MIYTEDIKVDSQGRLVECPVCKNTEFTDDSRKCSICGMNRYNECIPEDDSFPHINPANARFCEHCGAKTIFFQHKLLLPWNVVSKRIKREASSQTVEDQLPF